MPGGVLQWHSLRRHSSQEEHDTSMRPYLFNLRRAIHIVCQAYCIHHFPIVITSGLEQPSYPIAALRRLVRTMPTALSHTERTAHEPRQDGLHEVILSTIEQVNPSIRLLRLRVAEHSALNVRVVDAPLSYISNPDAQHSFFLVNGSTCSSPA